MYGQLGLPTKTKIAIAAVLNHFEVKPSQMASITGRSDRTCQRWCSDEDHSEPSLSEFAALVERLPLLVSESLRGIIAPREVPACDLNGDGKTGTDDVMELVVMGDTLEANTMRITHAALRDNRIDSNEKQAIEAGANEEILCRRQLLATCAAVAG